MSATAGLGLLILGVFVFLMLALALVERRWPATFRPIEYFDALGSATERAVEFGRASSLFCRNRLACFHRCGSGLRQPGNAPSGGRGGDGQ